MSWTIDFFVKKVVIYINDFFAEVFGKDTMQMAT